MPPSATHEGTLRAQLLMRISVGWAEVEQQSGWLSELMPLTLSSQPPAGVPVAPSGPKKKSLKELIENNVAIFLASAIITGFVARFGAYEAILKVAHLETISQDHLNELTNYAGLLQCGQNACGADLLSVIRKCRVVAIAKCSCVSTVGHTVAHQRRPVSTH